MRITVEGDYASFNRPEMKVERVSYDVPTPSAIEGMLKSIYWKPSMRYYIDKIIVYYPIKFINIRRNEVKSKISFSKVKQQMNGKGCAEIYIGEERSQRASMLLKDVKYGIEFHIELTGLKDDEEKNIDAKAKHYNIMQKRLEKGQYFRHPCLGCSEFPVRKIELVEDFNLDTVSPELKGDIDLGYMLYGLRFIDGGKPINGDWENPKFSDKADALYYRPHMINGIIDVNKYRKDIIC